MVKRETAEIQQQIAALGENLGFQVEMEARQKTTTGKYSPVTDVAWFIDLTQHYRIELLKSYFEQEADRFQMLKRLPLAGFEIEGSTTSSKNQVSNFANLLCGQYLFNFVIVNNSAAGNENDTYRRGMKIYRYFQQVFGKPMTIFCDWSQFQKSISNLEPSRSMPRSKPVARSIARSGKGGETVSLPTALAILENLNITGLEIKQNWQPEWINWKFNLAQRMQQSSSAGGKRDPLLDFHLLRCGYKDPDHQHLQDYRHPKDMYYIPQIDIVAGLRCPEQLQQWLSCLADQLDENVVFFPLLHSLQTMSIEPVFLPLIGFEIESSANKHMNGGIVNLAHNCWCGLLVGPPEAEAHLRLFQSVFGCPNVYYLNCQTV